MPPLRGWGMAEAIYRQAYNDKFLTTFMAAQK
jgi:hypothetical protein